MAGRMRSLGFPAVAARTFHSAALAQLRHFWPLRHPDRPLPGILADKWRLVAPFARTLPGGYRFTPGSDLVDEIHWAKAAASARTPTPHPAEPPIPVDLFVRVYRRYEQAKARQGLIDFDDMLALTVDMLESDGDVVRQARTATGGSRSTSSRTPRIPDRLLELWLGDRRRRLRRGRRDQTIYTFAGATPSLPARVRRPLPRDRVIPLVENYRSSPQVLDLANRLLASTGRPKPARGHPSAGARGVCRRSARR